MKSVERFHSFPRQFITKLRTWHKVGANRRFNLLDKIWHDIVQTCTLELTTLFHVRRCINKQFCNASKKLYRLYKQIGISRNSPAFCAIFSWNEREISFFTASFRFNELLRHDLLEHHASYMDLDWFQNHSKLEDNFNGFSIEERKR